MVLSKEEILKGIHNIQEIEIKSLGGSLYLRPLSETELNEVDMIEAQGLGIYESTQKGRSQALNKGKINLAKATESTSKAKLHKIHLSINNDKNEDTWSIEEIGNLSRDVVNELIEKIDEISGVEITKSDVEQFPEE